MSCRKQHYYNTLDFFRLVCAVLVVFIHMGYGNQVAFIPCLTAQAVPFFFFVSGFFFEKKAKTAELVSRFGLSYAKSILAVYAVWVLLWLPYIIHDAVAEHAGKNDLYITLIVLRRVLLAGIAPYWYLLTLAEGIVVLAFILQSNQLRLGWLLCLGGLFLGLVYTTSFFGGIGDKLRRIIYVAFSWENNFIMRGFPLLFIGAAVSRKEDTFNSQKRPLILILYAVSVLTAFLLHTKSDDLFGLPLGIIQGFLLFLLCILSSNLESRIPDGLCHFARDLSSVIFLTHTFFLIVIGKHLHIWNTPERLIILTSCSVIFLLVLRKLKWKPIKRLFIIKS